MALVEERLERRSKQLHDERRVPVTRLGVVDLRNAFCAGRNHRSHIANRKQDNNNDNKLAKLASTHIFYPFAIETAGTWHEIAIEFTQEIGMRITTTTEDTRETTFLFQRFSMALQRGNAVSFHNTMVTE